MGDLSSLPLAQPFDFPEGEHGVLLIHGFTGSPAHMRKIGDALRADGFAVRGILLPGHGTKPEDMARCSWQDWLLCARQAAREMRGKYRFFSVAGLSMGGVLALMLAEEMEVTACVSIAAPMKTQNPFTGLAPVLAPFHPTTQKRSNPLRALMDAEYDLGYDSFPTKSVHDLRELTARARQHLNLISCPILAVQSRKDATVAPASPDIILRGVTSEKRAMLWLSDSPHVCTITPEAETLARQMAAFLRGAEKES